jgi:diguanylate cyclase (GGDEF)-like protein/PAS domain S-box-containing protein
MAQIDSHKTIKTEKTEETLNRLVAANARVQDTAMRADWAVERVLLKAIINQVPELLYAKDTKGRFVAANDAVARDNGLQRAEELIGKTDFDNFPAETAQRFFDIEQAIIASGHPMIDMEELRSDESGNTKWLLTTKVPMKDDNGIIVGLIGVARNITERKRAESQIYFMAHHDALTSLPNRSLLMERLAQAINQAKRDERRVTVVFMDLDNFKVVNDSLGHNAGDMLLKVIAERMLKCVRATDTVVRLGGDEFVILLVDQENDIPTVTAAILERLRAAVAEPVVIDKQAFRVTSSIGLATFPEDGASAQTLLMNADIAMYQAKEKGRDNFQFYTSAMTDAALERRILQEGLRGAIANAEFTLVYQPQVDLRSGTILAVEALVRWNHPTLGLISPLTFIPLAEESGLIVPLGDWVLREACRQSQAWQDAGIAPVRVSVNVSARQFKERTWVAQVSQALHDTGLAPKYLELELTESMLMHDVDQAVATMRELEALGVQFSIDDFGTGYSSLSALKSFPVARLKIDQSFVRHLPHDADDRSIATAVISLGQKLNMRVIAEGVETEEQLAFLQANNCDEIQGYFFSRPVGPDALGELLRKQKTGVIALVEPGRSELR